MEEVQKGGEGKILLTVYHLKAEGLGVVLKLVNYSDLCRDYSFLPLY